MYRFVLNRLGSSRPLLSQAPLPDLPTHEGPQGLHTAASRTLVAIPTVECLLCDTSAPDITYYLHSFHISPSPSLRHLTPNDSLTISWFR